MKTMVFVAIGVALSMPGEVDPYDESVKRAYDYSNWCGRTRMDYPRLVQDWRLPALSLPTNDLDDVAVGTQVIGTPSFVLVETNGHTLVRVNTKVYSDVRGAHEALMWRFAHSMNPYPCPQVTNDIGDVLFYRRFTNGVGGVSFADSGSFARNNVAVWIRSYASSCPATNIAKQIDVSILRASGVEP